MPKEIVKYQDGKFGYEITERFLRAINTIIGNRDIGKQTQALIGEVVGISSSNINRMRSDPSRRVSVDACGRLCDHYKVSTHWLLLGEGQMYSNDELLAAYKNIEKRMNDLEKSFLSLEKEMNLVKRKIKR
jgi:hypothetical protein